MGTLPGVLSMTRQVCPSLFGSVMVTLSSASQMMVGWLFWRSTGSAVAPTVWALTPVALLSNPQWIQSRLPSVVRLVLPVAGVTVPARFPVAMLGVTAVTGALFLAPAGLNAPTRYW